MGVRRQLQRWRKKERHLKRLHASDATVGIRKVLHALCVCVVPITFVSMAIITIMSMSVFMPVYVRVCTCL